MKARCDSALMLLTIAMISCFLSSCAIDNNRFVTYRPPGKSTNLGIEVIEHPDVPPKFELRINGQYVMTLDWTMFDYHRSATGIYNTKPVEMRGQYFPGGRFAIDVFIDEERAGNFRFP
jgi:hypothetical protein